MSLKNFIILIIILISSLFIGKDFFEDNKGISSYIIKNSNKAILGAILPLENSTIFIKYIALQCLKKIQ